MVKKRLRNFNAKEAVEFFNHVMQDKPLLPFLIPLGFFAWAIERWLVPFSNWVPLAFAVWATIQYARFERQLLVEDLNRRWKQLIANSSHSTPLEPCEWLNKLLMEIWPNYMEPRISKRFSSLVETRLKHRRPRLIERIELQEFSLGSCPPSLGQNGVHWIASGDQQVMRMGFEWNTNDMSVMLLAKLAKPLRGTARIVINNMFIKGHLRFIPILDGQAVLYSFESTPEVRIGVAFGSGGSQTLPATELPGVSTWLVKLFTETLNKMMVEPRRGCYSLPTVDIRKRAVGGVLSVTVVSASKLGQTSLYNHKQTREGYTTGSNSVGNSGSKMLQTFVEVEIGDLTRRTSISQGLNPRWDASFNMVLHGDSGILKFHLYEWDPNSVKFNYLTSCEIKMKYVADGTTSFWAIGPESSVVAKQAEYCGKEVEMVVPFEETTLGESKTYGLRIRKTLDVLLRTIRDVTVGKDITLNKGWSWICVSQCTSSLTVKLVLKEWQYSDGQISLDKYSNAGSQHSTYSSQLLQLQTGRKIKITVVEGRNLMTKDKSGKCDPYVKILYGKALHRTKTISNATSPVWNQRFEFDEIGGGEYLKIRCYNADRFGDEHIGSARVNLEGLIEGSCKDVWIPLEKVNIGELRLQIELLKSEDPEGSKNSAGKYGNGWIELVVIEARDLIAADLRGTSDPYVRVQYGNSKKRTKVIYKTLNPQWYQTFEFPDIGSPLVLYVKDYNALLPKSSIGDCVVEYDLLPPNQTADKWIPLQGVKNGEIHVQVTRRVPEMQMKMSLDTDASSLTKAQGISGQVRDLVKKLQGLVEDGDLEGLSLALSELETTEDAQEEYTLQLEREKTLLIDKISELGREIMRASSLPSKISF